MLRELMDRYLKHNDIVIDDQIYMRRYLLIRFGRNWPQLRIHHIRLADAGRELHDHPFDFASFLMKGAYVEEQPHTEKLRRRFSLAFRRATAMHRINELHGDVWTLVVASKIKRRWGFMVDGKWVPNKVVSEGRAYITPTVRGV
jgi:hypothetical protein